MDFLTLFPYLGILALIGLNTWLVVRRDIVVEESEHEPDKH